MEKEGKVNKKVIFIGGAVLIVLSIIWFLFISQRIGILSDNFSYKAKILSIDNFYDSKEQNYLGEQNSKTYFSYDVVSHENNILIMKNIFDVRTLTGDKIFTAERIYGIDPKTGEHAAGYGDHDRDGYLFAPKHLKRGDPYTYWHINYDVPANMEFQEVEEINGLKVYRYETDYHADQTANLGFLPEVGITRGINLDINLQQWIEPITGRMIKYEDNTIAYYYDLKTKERIYPWNKFHNQYQDISINEQVDIAKMEKNKIIWFGYFFPIILLLIGLGLLIFNFVRKGNGKRKYW